MASRVLKLGVLVSGRGSNLQALLDAEAAGWLPARVVLVLSDVEDAPALERAKAHGVEALFIDPNSCDIEEKSMALLDERGVELICLAGFMRILSPGLVSRYLGRIVNIHPSLLPSFRGLRAQRKALRAGVRVAGCTVHFVSEEVDAGPIIIQASVPVLLSDTEESLAERILAQEHRIYPLAVKYIADGRVSLKEGRAVWRDFEEAEAGSIISPSERAPAEELWEGVSSRLPPPPGGSGSSL